MRTWTISTWFSLLLLCPVAQARDGDSLVVDLRILLGQTTASNSNWSDAQLLRILNMAQDKVSARGRVVEKDTTYAGSTTLPLRVDKPSDFIALRGTAYIRRNGRDLIRVPVTNADSATHIQPTITPGGSNDADMVIYEEGGQIVISPQVNPADSVHVFFFAQPQDIVDSLESEYPDEWEIILLYDAKVMALEKNRDAVWFPLAVSERNQLLADVMVQTRLRPQLVKQP